MPVTYAAGRPVGVAVVRVLLDRVEYGVGEYFDVVHGAGHRLAPA
jgi:hypothetical protein